MELLAQATETTATVNVAEVVLFGVFSVMALGAALAVVTMRNILHGALMLVVNLLAVAGLFLTLESSFLAIIQVLVYAGAIMVLFLFVIMLLGVGRDDLLFGGRGGRQLAAAAAGFLLAAVLVTAFVGPYTGDASVCGTAADPTAVSAEGIPCAGLAGAYAEGDDSGVAFLGLRMFTRYTWPFELSALLLTVATIGAVIMARRRDLEPEDTDEAAAVVTATHHPDHPTERGSDVPADADVREELGGLGEQEG
jgi:NADH-quinone oxidoreductase subunit J